MFEGENEYTISTVITVVNIYDYNTSQLPQISGEASMRDLEQWFFLVPRQETTRSLNHVYSSDNRIVGMKRTMVFYSGRAPNGKKTDWKMNEYKAIQLDEASSSNQVAPKLRQEFSLCRVYKKSKCLRIISATNSPESSPSIDHGQPPQEDGEASQMDIVDYDALLDWEQVDWFLGSEP
uniref:NAC family transcription factor n=1 Tax=Melilotus albus TaxID=47082 RepID=A0A896WFQ3_MELAB|nr:NAC family transcription factor [Melilotus albus]